MMSLEYSSCTALPSLNRNRTFAYFVFLVETLIKAVTVAISFCSKVRGANIKTVVQISKICTTSPKFDEIQRKHKTSNSTHIILYINNLQRAFSFQQFSDNSHFQPRFLVPLKSQTIDFNGLRFFFWILHHTCTTQILQIPVVLPESCWVSRAFLQENCSWYPSF